MLSISRSRHNAADRTFCDAIRNCHAGFALTPPLSQGEREPSNTLALWERVAEGRVRAAGPTFFVRQRLVQKSTVPGDSGVAAKERAPHDSRPLCCCPMGPCAPRSRLAFENSLCANSSKSLTSSSVVFSQASKGGHRPYRVSQSWGLRAQFFYFMEAWLCKVFVEPILLLIWGDSSG